MQLTHLRREGDVCWLGFVVSRGFRPDDLLAEHVEAFRRDMASGPSAVKLQRAATQAKALAERAAELEKQIADVSEAEQRLLDSPGLDRVEHDAGQLAELDGKAAALREDLAAIKRQKQLIDKIHPAARQEHAEVVRFAERAQAAELRKAFEAEQTALMKVISTDLKQRLERLAGLGSAIERLALRDFRSVTAGAHGEFSLGYAHEIVSSGV